MFRKGNYLQTCIDIAVALKFDFCILKEPVLPPTDMEFVIGSDLRSVSSIQFSSFHSLQALVYHPL
jgi:hypothetical protein